MGIFGVFNRKKKVEKPQVEPVVEKHEPTFDEKFAEFKAKMTMYGTEVPFYFGDGSVEFIANDVRFKPEEDVYLYTDGGKVYHTVGYCYALWDSKYRENFKGWDVISFDETQSRGLKKCSYCEEEERKRRELLKRSKYEHDKSLDDPLYTGEDD